MALMDFIKKQFIDVIQWTEDSDGTLAWRFPMAGMEIQNGGTLVVRESQMAIFVNEGQVADVFGPGTYKLTTQTLPVLTYLKNWDKLFESPFKSDVYFFSTRLQIDQKWGTPQPITIRDKDFGAVRLRAFGNYAFRIADPKLFHTEISGTRESYTVAEVDGQLRGLVLQNISNAIASSGLPFLDLAANQIAFANALAQELQPAFAKLGPRGLCVANDLLVHRLRKPVGVGDALPDRVLLVQRLRLRRAVHGGARTKHEPRHPALAHQLEQVERRDKVGAVVACWLLSRFAHGFEASEVDHRVKYLTRECRARRLEICKVSPHDRDAGASELLNSAHRLDTAV